MLMISIILFLFLIFIGLLSKWFYLKYKYFDKGLYAKYSGERIYPFIGNVWSIIQLKPYDIMDYITKLTFQHGGSLILQLGYYYAIFIADYKLTEHIMMSNTITTKAEPYRFGINWAGTGLLISNGEKWRKRRKMITPAFHYQILETFLPVFHSASDTLVQILAMEVDRGVKVIEIHSLVTLCTLDIICETAMGITINAQIYKESEYVRTVKEISELLFKRLISPLCHYDFLYRFTWIKHREEKCIKYLHSHTNSIIKSRQTKDQIIESGVKNKCAFLDILLQSTIDGKPLSDEDIREEVDTFMFEGHDTTASAISFALYFVAQYPDIQKKILDEQKLTFGKHLERAATFNELTNMKYLEMVIKETLRLYPSVPIFGREVTQDFEFDGVKFKKGLQLGIVVYALHRNPEHFPEPEKFIPERFLPENKIESKPFAYIPFAAGPRNCIGQRFAMLEMKSTLSKVLRYFELVPVEPKHNIQVVPEVILKSCNGFPIQFKRRHYTDI